jgi:multiple sugar transport system substrate-binding protein
MKRMKLKQTMCLLLSILLVALTMVGCAAETGTTENGEKVVLNFIRWSNGPALDAEEQDKVKRFQVLSVC